MCMYVYIYTYNYTHFYFQNIGIGTVDKLFLKFPNSWWPKDTTGFSFLWSDDDREQFIKENKVCNNSK